jgi:hypothetical protein
VYGQQYLHYNRLALGDDNEGPHGFTIVEVDTGNPLSLSLRFAVPPLKYIGISRREKTKSRAR